MMDIARVMATAIPGTFVPDMRPSEAPAVAPIPGLPAAVPPAGAKPADAAPSFKDTVKQMLLDVSGKLTVSDQNTRDFATGKTKDLNGVVTSVEEANLALQYTMAIRTKLLDAYTEINRMTV